MIISTALAVLCLCACTCARAMQPFTRLSGVIAIGGPLARAHVTVRDSRGVTLSTQASVQGEYRLDVSSLMPPMVLVATEAENRNCRDNDRPRGICMTAWRATLKPGDNTANVNPLTDAITSELAAALHFIGPQQFAESSSAPGVAPQIYAQALQRFRDGFGPALAQVGVPDINDFDPVTEPMYADGRGVDAILLNINHTRGYDNDSGEPSTAVITDKGWRPILAPFGPQANEVLQLDRARREHEAIQAAPVRIFIVGDSTAATYERQRLPRMGWGQVFQESFKPESGALVINGARAGRSARDFFNSGWYRQITPYIARGDYVIIGFGHNDQNCNGQRTLRGVADVANLCAYPNDVHGQRQFPPEHTEMSFQAALEVYVNDVRARGAIPLLLTPTTRYLNVDRKPAHFRGDARPVVSQHLTRQNALGGYAFVGDYSQTIKDTARANHLPLIDLEAQSIDFANRHAQDWQDYWLVVADTVKFPWYATQTSGTSAAPDTTHFQEAGARAMAALVAQGIRETLPLQGLAQYLKRELTGTRSKSIFIRRANR